MGWILLIAFIGVPLIEIAVFIQVGGLLGLWPTLLIVVLTAVAGTALLRRQGLATLRRAQQNVSNGELPVAEIFDAVCLLVAGALLLTPGFVTDGIGAVLLVPALRAALRRSLAKRFVESGNVWVNGEPLHGRPHPAHRSSDGSFTIDGDYTDVSETQGATDGPASDKRDGESGNEGPGARRPPDSHRQ